MSPSRRVALLVALVTVTACASSPPPFVPPKEEPGAPKMLLAMVLLSEARLPDPTRLVRAFERFDGRPTDEAFEPAAPDEATIAVSLEGVGTGFVGLMPIAVPGGEADSAADFSAQRLGSEDRPLAPHSAHLIVSLQLDEPDAAASDLSTFTSFVAAVAETTPSVGVYWGAGGVTHDRRFFLERAADDALASRVLLWFGVTLAEEDADRMSFMSHGMAQLDQPELLLGVRKAAAGDGAETFFSILAYLADHGSAFGDGDTVGFDEATRWKVHYVPSPTDPSAQACRIDLP